MKHIAQLFLSMVFAGVVVASAQADPVKITFEQPPCAALASGEYPSDCYAGVGVILSSDLNGGRFTAPRIAIAADADAVSPPNVAKAGSGFTDIRGGFIVPGGMGGFTDFVSWNVTGSVPFQDPWEAIILGNTGRVLDSILGFSDQLVSFSRPGRDVAGIFMAMGNAVQGMDNLSFNAPQSASPTPEPATLLLMASGAVMVLRRRRPSLLVRSVRL